MDREKKAQIARENGAKGKGPVTPEGKETCARNAIKHGRRATALKLIVPPHSACLANEDRQAFYKLYDALTAKFRPEDDTELALVREIAEFQWQINRNKQMETAIYNRELMRQGARVEPSLPELRHLEISIAAREALTGNKTIAELRRDNQTAIRAISHLQRRLIQLQNTFPAADPVPPTPAEERQLHLVEPDAEPEPAREQDNEQTDGENPEVPEESTDSFEVTGEVTKEVIDLYTRIFHPRTLALVGREPYDDLEAA